MDRRQFLASAAGLALGTLAAPAIAQSKTKLRVGYLHTVAVDGQIWTGMDQGMFDRQGLDLELRQFNTGLEIFQALIGDETWGRTSFIPHDGSTAVSKNKSDWMLLLLEQMTDEGRSPRQQRHPAQRK